MLEQCFKEQRGGPRTTEVPAPPPPQHAALTFKTQYHSEVIAAGGIGRPGGPCLLSLLIATTVV